MNISFVYWSIYRLLPGCRTQEKNRMSERGFTSNQRKKVIYGRVKHGKRRNNRGEQQESKRGGWESKKNRSCAATLCDLYPSTYLAWVALTGV